LICHFCNGVNSATKTCCQAHVRDVKHFHSSTKLIKPVIYSMYSHTHSWPWGRIFIFLTKAQNAVI
jgi:hypothetical protein